MRFRIHLMAALACSAAVIATSQSATAQSQSTSLLRSTAAAAPATSGGGLHPAALPPGSMNATSTASSSGTSDGYYAGFPGDGSYGASGCGENYCDQGCYDAPCGGSYVGPSGLGLCNNGGQFFFQADYLNVRASFSEATAKVIETLNGSEGSDRFVPLDFEPQSSYRFGGGYRLCCCGEEIRFLYTRMTSQADDTAVNGDLVPIEASPPPGGETLIHADVDAQSYDIEWAKTIPLGGCCCDSCGDACGSGCAGGCGSGCCRPCCPAWDITWSGGVRIADVGWSRGFNANDANGFNVTQARSTMDFQGGGLRAGLEGRRYFCKDGWLSLYGKGNISLLYGTVDIKTIRGTFDPSTGPTAFNTQTFTNRQIIPVTDIEAGMTAQVTSHSAISAGYLMSAWHDLGARDQDQLNTLLPIQYDDANILGFDGFFARVEVAF